MERHFYWAHIADVPQWVITTPEPASGEKFEEPWMFGAGRPLPDPGPLQARVRNPGPRSTYVLAGVERVPIISEAIADVFRTLTPEDVQLFPVTVEGESDPYFIVTAIKTIDCIDEANCQEVHLYGQDAPSPERIGAYRWIYGLRIDPARTEGARVFRTKRIKTAFIVSEEIKEALERVGSLGVDFEHVTGPHTPITGTSPPGA